MVIVLLLTLDKAFKASSSNIPLEVPSDLPTVMPPLNVLAAPNCNKPPRFPLVPFHVPFPKKAKGAEPLIILVILIVPPNVVELEPAPVAISKVVLPDPSDTPMVL